MGAHPTFLLSELDPAQATVGHVFDRGTLPAAQRPLVAPANSER